MGFYPNGGSGATAWEPQPDERGFLAWNYDPGTITSSTAPTAGSLYVSKVRVPSDMTVGKVVKLQRGAVGGSPATVSNAFMALFDKDGVRLGVTANEAAAVNGTLGSGLRSWALTADATGSLDLVGGPDEYVYVARLIGTQSGTAVTEGTRAQAISVVSNVGLMVAAAGAFSDGAIPNGAVAGTGLSAVPTTIDLAASTPATDFWAALAA